jgi:hypothetical protein
MQINGSTRGEFALFAGAFFLLVLISDLGYGVDCLIVCESFEFKLSD